jgi:hypothetical protein
LYSIPAVNSKFFAILEIRHCWHSKSCPIRISDILPYIAKAHIIEQLRSVFSVGGHGLMKKSVTTKPLLLVELQLWPVPLSFLMIIGTDPEAKTTISTRIRATFILGIISTA